LKGHLSVNCERGLLGPTGLLTLPGDDWSLPDKRPRNSYMMNLDGQCKEGAEGENYRKLPRLVKQPKKRSLEESCASLIVGIADGGEIRRRRKNNLKYH